MNKVQREAEKRIKAVCDWLDGVPRRIDRRRKKKAEMLRRARQSELAVAHFVAQKGRRVAPKQAGNLP
jgi:hypothetical protein